ncbi:MAG: PQQ-binding-like beta-propeller repeat protein, partial [Armatimonadetes bacterium]|nr:PQQ-binding-like beta-propeller repeat protein [Armatimonadota bacterium]
MLFESLRWTNRRLSGSCAPALLIIGAAMVMCALVPRVAVAQNKAHVTLYHNDFGRTGANQNESTLTLANVNPTDFGKLFQHNVDGQIYAQPLYVPHVAITNPQTGAVVYHNVVYVATEHDSVYAFDADNNIGDNAGPLWEANFDFPQIGITPMPSDDVNSDDIYPEIGITGTPVISLSGHTLYVVATTLEPDGAHQHLHALDLGTGYEQSNSPVDISASVPGVGDGTDGNGNVPFDPLWENQRAALQLWGNTLYIAWGSHGDNIPYHGWVLAYDATTLQLTGAWNSSPNGVTTINPDGSTGPPAGGGIWMGGGGITLDKNGNLFLATGNGIFDADPTFFSGGTEYGDSVLKLNFNTETGFNVADYFTPYNQDVLNSADLDLGSAAPMLLPDQPGAHPHELIQVGKEGTIYVINRDNMGGFNLGSDSQIVQELPGAVGGVWGMPAYWNNMVYFGGVGDSIQQFQLKNGLLSATPTASTGDVYDYPGATPSISSNGVANGILWAIQPVYPNDGTAPAAVLKAYNATNLNQLFSSTALGPVDGAGTYVKFAVPTIANGKVYVGAQNRLTIYGLRPAPPQQQVDHFTVTGPVYVPAYFNEPLLASNIYEPFSITAVGSDGNPEVFTGRVYCAARESNGSLFPLGTVTFNNQTNVIRWFLMSNFGNIDGEGFFEFVATDGHGHDATAPYEPIPGFCPFIVFPTQLIGPDHFQVRAPVNV